MAECCPQAYLIVFYYSKGCGKVKKTAREGGFLGGLVGGFGGVGGVDGGALGFFALARAGDEPEDNGTDEEDDDNDEPEREDEDELRNSLGLLANLDGVFDIEDAHHGSTLLLSPGGGVEATSFGDDDVSFGLFTVVVDGRVGKEGGNLHGVGGVHMDIAAVLDEGGGVHRGFEHEGVDVDAVDFGTFVSFATDFAEDEVSNLANSLNICASFLIGLSLL